MTRFSSTSLKRAGFLLFAGLVVCFTMFFPGAALASPPEVVASSPSDGAQAVPCKGRMWLQFENNVAAVSGNEKLIALETADGHEVPPEHFTASLPDTEVEFGFRQYVWVDVKGLEPGADYVIHVKPGVTAKNGAVNDSDTRISFTTAAAGQDAVALADPKQIEGGSGNGDGTGGGKAAGDGGDQGGNNDSKAADAASSSGAASASASNGSRTGADASPSSADAARSGDVEVVYVDANGKLLSNEEEEREPIPAGELVLFALCALAVVAGLLLAVRKSHANVIESNRDRKER